LAFCEITARSIIIQQERKEKAKNEQRIEKISEISSRLKRLRSVPQAKKPTTLPK
jgi:hypothetical protein